MQYHQVETLKEHLGTNREGTVLVCDRDYFNHATTMMNQMNERKASIMLTPQFDLMRLGRIPDVHTVILYKVAPDVVERAKERMRDEDIHLVYVPRTYMNED